VDENLRNSLESGKRGLGQLDKPSAVVYYQLEGLIVELRSVVLVADDLILDQHGSDGDESRLFGHY